MAEYKTTVTETEDGGRTITSGNMTEQEAAKLAAKRERTKNMNTSDSQSAASDALDKDIAAKKRYTEMQNILASGKHKSMSDEEKEAFVKEYKKLKLDYSFAEGGVVPMNEMSKQMEMFDEGGLMDEGGTVDPVSGNDVPPGSTQEEVRDDIPAQLSEGEFVMPADVVRYHGLDKMMALRDEAKMGLQRMEDMGQMGNSEEAIIPDNLPFTIDDIDMEDDEEPQEFNVGGVALPGGQAGTQVVVYGPDGTAYNNPAAAQAAGVTNYTMTPPSTAPAPAAPAAPAGQATAPVQAASAQFQPAGTKFTSTETQEAIPTFKDTIGLGVPYVDYDPNSEEETEKPEETDSPLVPTTTTPQQPQGDGGDSRDFGGGTSLTTGEKIAGYSPEEIKSGVASAKDRYAIDGNRGFDLLNLLPTGLGTIVKSVMPDSVSAAIFAKDPTYTGRPDDALMDKQQTARKELEQSLGTRITGYVGFEKGDLDPNSGGFFNKDGIAIDPKTGAAAKNESGTMNYSSIQDFKNAIAAGNKSGWRGGVISSTDYKGLSTKGKANYDKYADLTNNRKGGAVSSKKAAEEEKQQAERDRLDREFKESQAAAAATEGREGVGGYGSATQGGAGLSTDSAGYEGGTGDGSGDVGSVGQGGGLGGGYGGGMGDYGGIFNKGGLVSQMKRSGLASKK